MKDANQVTNEQGVLAIMTIIGFVFPPLWVIVVLLYIGGYGRG
jgi:hypothetical protein